MPRHDPSTETVHILMAVFNGGETLPAQLNSIAAQTHSHWCVLASDDGSQDNSRQILEDFRATYIPDRVKVFEGPQNGSAENFLELLRRAARQDPAPRWIAFSDQDDVWIPNKVSRALSALMSCDPMQPALYCSRTWITCNALSSRRLSPPRPRAPDFRNALVQNIAAGNTIVLNPAAVSLVLEAVKHVDTVVVHDWWLYQLITGAGGQVLHDDMPSLLYRQHDANQIGVNDTFSARVRRLAQLLRGDFRMWNRTNVAALRSCNAALRPEHRVLLDAFSRLSTLPFIQRMLLLRRLKLYRQTTAGTLSLWFAVAFRLV